MMPAGPLQLRLFVVLVLAEVLAIAALVVLAMTRSGTVLDYPVTWRIFVLVPLFLYVGFGVPLLGFIILGAMWQIATYPLRKKCKTCTRKAALYSADWGTDLAGFFGPDTRADMNANELGLCVDCAATRKESRARSHRRSVT
jgi:hypothetical protein